jgi:hypothetical protein
MWNFSPILARTINLKTAKAYGLAAARLKELFAGIPGIRIVDDSYDCLRGEEVRELLEACGATRYIYPTETKSNLSETEKYELRRDAGYVNATCEFPIEDYIYAESQKHCAASL